MCILLTAVVFAESIAALIYSIGTLGTLRSIIPAVFIAITLIVIGCAVVGGVVAHKPKLLLVATVMQVRKLQILNLLIDFSSCLLSVTLLSHSVSL